MKLLKKAICMTLSILSMITLCACVAEQPAPTSFATHPEPMHTQPWEPKVTEPGMAASETTADEQVSYESDIMIPYASMDKAADSFLEFADDTQMIFRARDGRLVHSQSLESGFWFAAHPDVQEVKMVWNNPAYLDSKGFLHIREQGKEFVCKDITGEIFYVFVDMLSGNLCICSQDAQGYLYYNAVAPTGVKDTYDNEKLFLYDFRTKTCYDRVDIIRCVQDDPYQPNLYVEVNGTAFYNNVTGIDLFGGEPQIWIDSAYAVPAESVITYGYGGAQSSLYRVDGDDAALYYRYGFDGIEIPLRMPQDKTVDQLDKVLFGECTLLVFRDGTVYLCRLTHTLEGTCPELEETLTNLNQRGAICAFYLSSFYRDRVCELRIRMDDNVTYVYLPYSE